MLIRLFSIKLGIIRCLNFFFTDWHICRHAMENIVHLHPVHLLYMPKPLKRPFLNYAHFTYIILTFFVYLHTIHTVTHDFTTNMPKGSHFYSNWFTRIFPLSVPYLTVIHQGYKGGYFAINIFYLELGFFYVEHNFLIPMCITLMNPFQDARAHHTKASATFEYVNRFLISQNSIVKKEIQNKN